MSKFSRYLSRPGRIVAAAIIALATSAALAPLTPAGATTTLGTPSGVHISAVTSSSFTVSLNPTANALHYRLFVSTTKSNVYVANISKARSTAVTTSTRLTASGLAFTTAPYYYRVEAMRTSTWRTWSPVYAVGLKPSMPTSVRVSSPASGTYLTWSSPASTGFQIAQGTNYAQTQNRHIYTIRGLSHQFSPYYLSKGVTYYFRVRSVNVNTGSTWSPRITVKAATRQQAVRVMTYNLLEATFDGTKESGQTVAPWSKRKVVAANLIKENNPDVVAIQEAAAWSNGGTWDPRTCGACLRQVDSLVLQLRAIGANYTLTKTEPKPGEPGWKRTGNYLLYKTSAYAAVGTGGNFVLGPNEWAAYQVIKNRATGAKALFVSPHLISGNGTSVAQRTKMDTQRKNEMADLATKAASVASRYGVPIVYAGDFNSTVNKNHAFDGPGIVLRSKHFADAGDQGQVLTNIQYNSANQYIRTALAFGDRIDHIYTGPGVAIRGLKVCLHLSHGKFVGVMASDHNALVSDIYLHY